MKNLFSLVLMAVAALGMTYAHGQENDNKDIIVEDAWVQAMPPSQKITAAYLTIINSTHAPLVLESVSSDIAEATEIHQMSSMNGMMHMSMATGLSIPAQGKVTLRPGAFHIMLINLKQPLKKGDVVPLTLHFQDNRTVTIRANVRDQVPL